MPLVSLVVPVYNVPEKLLRRCIESMQNQTMEDIEIILMDDGSTDGSAEVCKAYADGDSRVRFFSQENQGPQYARNAAIRHATGEAMAFIDSDDWVEPDMCRLMYDAMKQYDLKAVFCAYALDMGKMDTVVSRISDVDRMYEGSELLQSIFLYNLEGRRKQPYFNMIGSPWGKMYDRAFFVENDLYYDPRLSHAEDIEQTHRSFMVIDKAFYITKPLYNHVYVNPGSISRRYQPLFGIHYAEAVEKIREEIAEQGDNELVMKAFYCVACVLLLGIGPNNAFHKDNPNPVSKQIADYKAICRRPVLADAVKKADLGVLPFSHSISVFTLRHRMYWAFYLICKVRQLQMKLWH